MITSADAKLGVSKLKTVLAELPKKNLIGKFKKDGSALADTRIPGLNVFLNDLLQYQCYEQVFTSLNVFLRGSAGKNVASPSKVNVSMIVLYDSINDSIVCFREMFVVDDRDMILIFCIILCKI